MPELQHKNSPEIPPALERWLRIATFELGDAARARVREEITDHFAASVENQVAQGQPRAVAETAALKALGNPCDEAKAYCRSYLTQGDMAFLRLFTQAGAGPVAWGLGKKFWLALGALALLTALLAQWQTGNHQESLARFVLSFNIPLAFLALAFLLVKTVDHGFAGKSLRARILFHGITLTAATVLFRVYLRCYLGYTHSIDFTGLWLLFFWWRAWPLQRKLKSGGKLVFNGEPERHA